jgi:hypothetical protein
MAKSIKIKGTIRNVKVTQSHSYSTENPQPIFGSSSLHLSLSLIFRGRPLQSGDLGSASSGCQKRWRRYALSNFILYLISSGCGNAKYSHSWIRWGRNASIDLPRVGLCTETLIDRSPDGSGGALAEDIPSDVVVGSMFSAAGSEGADSYGSLSFLTRITSFAVWYKLNLQGS